MGEVSKAQFESNVNQFRIFDYKLLIKDVSWTLSKIYDEVVCKSSSSVIRQKDESQNECYNKRMHAKYFVKRTFLTPLIRTCAYQGVRNIRFSENLTYFVFL